MSLKVSEIPDDMLFSVSEFLKQSDLINFSQVCRDLHRIGQQSQHLKAYIVKNPTMATHANRQRNLEAVFIHGVLDAQLYFTHLPSYVFFGHCSSWGLQNEYRGIPHSPPSCIIIHPQVTTLFIEGGIFKANWDIFPNLENLFIKTSQRDLDLTSLSKCTKLKKVIVSVKDGLMLLDPVLSTLPELEIFVVSGVFSEAVTMTSSKLHTFMLNPRRSLNPMYIREDIREDIDELNDEFNDEFEDELEDEDEFNDDSDDELEDEFIMNSYIPDSQEVQFFRNLFQTHHIVPTSIKTAV